MRRRASQPELFVSRNKKYTLEKEKLTLEKETQAKILIITNDFPPKQGGIEKFVIGITRCLPAEDIIVLTSQSTGDRDFDATVDFPVYRHPVKYLLPTPRVYKIVRELIDRHGCSQIWFGAAAPLGLLAMPLRSCGMQKIIATTHGHEIWWAHIPFTRLILRIIGKYCDIITYLGDFTHKKLRAAFGPHANMQRLVPGVDATIFKPDTQANNFLCEKYGLTKNNLIILSLSRLVERKGQDYLIKIWPEVLTHIPQAILMIAGSGPYKAHLTRLAAASSASDAIVFCDAISDTEIPLYYAGSHIFAMPCRSRKMGLEVEGLGIVYLEAQAAGLPVIVGNSGGAPDAVLPKKTGLIVEGNNPAEIIEALKTLSHPVTRSTMSQNAREWMLHNWSWHNSAEQLLDMFDRD